MKNREKLKFAGISQHITIHWYENDKNMKINKVRYCECTNNMWPTKWKERFNFIIIAVGRTSSDFKHQNEFSTVCYKWLRGVHSRLWTDIIKLKNKKNIIFLKKLKCCILFHETEGGKNIIFMRREL